MVSIIYEIPQHRQLYLRTIIKLTGKLEARILLDCSCSHIALVLDTDTPRILAETQYPGYRDLSLIIEVSDTFQILSFTYPNYYKIKFFHVLFRLSCTATFLSYCVCIRYWSFAAG